ncbi:MAG TPA: hypothetical protein VLK65_29435 [Vicinamibacteria bacterium]|nr:hypothetical protein [Vicinamibacteria bacterium]
MTRQVGTTLALVAGATLLFPRHARSQAGEEDERDTGAFFEVAYGWTAVQGNDVHVGDRTSVGSMGLFDDSTFEPLVTRMSTEWMPYVRGGYRGEAWGLEGEFWRVDTGGAVGGSFTNSPFGRRREMVQLFDVWYGEEADETSFEASNNLMVWSFRLDVTRRIARTLSVRVGLHVAELENERTDQVLVSSAFPFFDLFGENLRFETTARARIDGQLLGPSVGVGGTALIGEFVRLGYSVSQSVLFRDLSHEADVEQTINLPFLPAVTFDTMRSRRASIPVTDLRVSFSFDIGSHLSIGLLGFASVWHDTPTALELSIPFEQWEEVDRTLVFGSVGPMVTVRF